MSSESEVRAHKREVFGEGPWLDEPDRVEWLSDGVHCRIARNDLGALCGYCGVTPGHPWHGRGREDIDADVHGGVTYARTQVRAAAKGAETRTCRPG